MRQRLLILMLLWGTALGGCWDATPNTPVARGKAFFNTGEWDEAIASFDEAIALNPLDAEAFLYRGQSYMCRGREHVGQALADYSEAIRLNPKSYEAYYHRAIAYRERGEKQKALADDLIARRLDPNAEKAALMRSAPTPEEYKAAFERAAEVDNVAEEGQINDALLETVPDFKPAKVAAEEAAPVPAGPEVALPGTGLSDHETSTSSGRIDAGLPVPNFRLGTLTDEMFGAESGEAGRHEERGLRARGNERNSPQSPNWQTAAPSSPPLTAPGAAASQPPVRRSSPVGTLPFGNPYQPHSSGYSPYSTGPRSTGIRSGNPMVDPNYRGRIPASNNWRNDPNAVQSLP